MTSAIRTNVLTRKNYARIQQSNVEIPYLIEVQKRSYEQFLQADLPPEDRDNETGLQGVFKSVFPIKDYSEMSSLEFVSYSLEPPKYDVEECHQRGTTYEAAVKVTIRLILLEEEEDGVKSIYDVKEQAVYFSTIPLMTDEGTFIINGTERVVVSQLHRSPGAFFDHDRGKSHASKKILYSARIIPYRGSWVDFEFDAKDILNVRIDRRRKLPATVLLRALGKSEEELLAYYYPIDVFEIEEDALYLKIGKKSTHWIGTVWDHDMTDLMIKTRDGTIRPVLLKGRKLTKSVFRKLIREKIKRVEITPEMLLGRYTAEDVVDMNTGEVLIECNRPIEEEDLIELRKHEIRSIKVLFIDGHNIGHFLRQTLAIDKCSTPEEAKLEIYSRIRPGDPPTLEMAEAMFQRTFFDPERYNLSKVGRHKLNHKFGLDKKENVLTEDDILETVRYLLEVKMGHKEIDDIDHLGNRRVRSVGELLENQYRLGLVRMERSIKERMGMNNDSTKTTWQPHDYINAKPVSAAVREYFGGSQLSQFMDQTNPLSEITHKRRLSALGPGGLTRERAGFEVRDVHTTHYGRICPIETPEGPNIGLIASLSTFARINEFGFIETPYRKVEDGKISEEVVFLSALEEEGKIIAQANAVLDENGVAQDYIPNEFLECRQDGEFKVVPADKVDYIDVSPNQLVSIAAALIPFLEHDDANRALMGANMQRQAVPLLKADAPMVGTGMESVVARDSGVTISARRAGTVEVVNASRIIIRPDPEAFGEDATPDIYNLVKYKRSNQNTCFNQHPIVHLGDKIEKGQVIADGHSTQYGDLALGYNCLVAFMPWGGYNFEDSILISEKLVREDIYTSIHIEEFECIARDTKIGKEEITRDIPNVSEEALKNLDESGIIRIGAEVKHGDILVGKVTPKGETPLSPEEKLLRAIFGEKAADVRDSSLRVPPGVVGTVIDVQVFSRKGIEKDSRTAQIEAQEKARIRKNRDEEFFVIDRMVHNQVKYWAKGQKAILQAFENWSLLKKSYITHLDAEIHRILGKIKSKGTRRINHYQQLENLYRAWFEKNWKGKKNTSKIHALAEFLRKAHELGQSTRTYYRQKLDKIEQGDELPAGVIKTVKVSLAIKRKIQVGDKMAGRHGNKGVVSKVLPIEDMPYLEDGTPVEMVLNPLGVPSRMNVGQILETHLGWAARGMGHKIDQMIREMNDLQKVKDYLSQIYGSSLEKTFESMTEEEIRAFAQRVRRGIHVATPVFDGAEEHQVEALLKEAGLDSSAQSILFDGRTGDAFASDVTVGIMYMLKLHHLVDDKIHARSIGPYSLVTQQPLGGKTQFGGQRLGEMEVWAMEAYGAAYSLQEFLTVKSDDTTGRTRMYESIVKGNNTLEAGLPESFNVLMKELQSLALDVELIEEQSSDR